MSTRGQSTVVEDLYDTLVSVLRSFGDDAFDTDETPARVVQSRCAEIIRRIALGARAGEDDSLPPDWASARRFVAEQRRREGEWVRRSQRDLSEAVRSFARALAHSVRDDRDSDRALGSALGDLTHALASSDPAAVRREAARMSELVDTAISTRKARQDRQNDELARHLRAAALEVQRAEARSALDPITELYSRVSLDDHAARVADLGALLTSAPCALVVQGADGGDAACKDLADRVVRVFLRREDFVARHAAASVAVVVADTGLAIVRARAQRVDLGGGLRAGLARLAPGESAESWLARAERAAAGADPGALGVAP